MIWNGIVHETIMGLFKNVDVIKLNSSANTWTRFSSIGTISSFKVTCVFIHDQATSDVFKLIREYL